jgi:erythronate-4-phosphate dehydrogenase
LRDKLKNMKIVADNKIPFLKGVLEPFCDVLYLDGDKISNSDLADVNALIIRTRTKCNEKLLAGTKVKFIATATIGYDHIDTEYCRKNDIGWTNAPGCNSGSVMQWFMAALLYYAKQNSIDLTKRSLGIIGVGNVGSKILKFAENIGVKVFLNDPPKVEKVGICGYLSLETILRESDIITFHVPLELSGKYPTYRMADEKFFKKIQSGTIIINSSRGEVIEENELNQTIQSGTISTALMDVWNNEPGISKLTHQNAFIATPHIAGYSADGKANGTAMSVSALSKFFGLPLEDWYPDEIPAFENMEISVDARKKSYQNVLTEIVLRTYDIAADDKKLRENLPDFEELRGKYPLRREFGAWTVNLQNDTRNFKLRLEELGFKLKS